MEMKDRAVITVDGLAGSGKTTLAGELAKKLGWIHFSSGLLYRAVAYVCLGAGANLQNEGEVVAALKSTPIIVTGDPSQGAQLFIGNRNISEEVRVPEVSQATSIVSTHAAVRNALIEKQRNAFEGQNIVAEGRDLGTVVFPGSPLKFFIKADEKVRVQRRLSQLYPDMATKSPDEVKLLNQKIQIEVHERDKRDTERAISPTIPAADAVIIDNSAQRLTVVVQSMYDAALDRGLI